MSRPEAKNASPHLVWGRDWLLGGRQPGELSLQRVDMRKVAADVVVATALPGRQPEPASRVGVARSGATQVDDGGQVLLLLQRGGGGPLGLQRLGHAAIQEPGGQLDGV